jgi:tungstate transport system substrate-binding protein
LGHLFGALTTLLFVSAAHAAPKAPPEVRIAVIGGLSLSGVWPELAKRAEAATGLRIVTVASAPKEGVVPPFVKGDAELLLMHGSDETYQLQAQGLAAPLRAWAQNELVFVGPANDPARVSEAHGGLDAIRRIAAADAPMVGFRDPGSFSAMQHLWRTAGLRPGPRQQLPDEGEQAHQVVTAAAKHGAYVVVGHIPVAFGKTPLGDYRVLLRGDPDLRRTFVLVEPGPRHPASAAQRALAHRLAEYLLGPKGQAALVEANQAIATPERPGPWVFPLPR